jgi:hypothetical protein
MKDKNNVTLNVGDKAIAYNKDTDEEILVTIEVIKKGYAEVTDENYDVFTFGSESLTKQEV